jgi:DNA-binding MarR family transcriptional regulator
MNNAGHPPGQSISQLFAAAARLSGNMWVRLLNDRLGIGWTAFTVLNHLQSQDGRTTREIAQASMVTPSTLTGVVDTLEKDGLIKRRRSDTDRRIIHLHLTDAGRQRIAVSADKLSSEFDTLFDNIDPYDEPAIRRFLLAAINRFTAELGAPGA